MTDRTARTAQMDTVLTRLATVAGRPWDVPAPESRGQRWRSTSRSHADPPPGAGTPRTPPGIDPPPTPDDPPRRTTDNGSPTTAEADQPDPASPPDPRAADPAQEEPFVVDSQTRPDRERTPRWWHDHPAAGLLRRVTPPRRTPIALVVGALALLAVVTYCALSTNPTPEPAPDLAAATVDHPRPSSTAPSQVVIDVVGKVNAPGVRTLPSGSRVRDALTAAGGPTPDADLSTLNLARPLVDGEQVRVGLPAAIPSAADPQNPPTTAPVDLNTATVQQLDSLPGVGTVTAQRILDWRTRHGRYSDVTQLQEVDGIGPSRFAKLRELVTAR
ncbi:putative comE operon protein 1 [Actinokineospora spheciospongiae]|uniref:Putative comE operon protein 1 n=1 Tax=Actinokineospora spheciospongiae TaxID=909613 RepID=W7IGZ8_9PSEU|nr:ComEA family DNA-binding protein [Actinokineospora spheciospongiae]EWC60155.1 putative comE operon protein 1 [Actinokineospora spheciospongiae]